MKLEPLVSNVFGRPYAEPDLMKPSPHSLFAAMKTLGTHGNESVLLDDSVSGVRAAKAAQAFCVGFANRPEKAEPLAAEGADLVVYDMASFARAFQALAA